jgi:hypothetical protein
MNESFLRDGDGKNALNLIQELNGSQRKQFFTKFISNRFRQRKYKQLENIPVQDLVFFKSIRYKDHVIRKKMMMLLEVCWINMCLGTRKCLLFYD